MLCVIMRFERGSTIKELEWVKKHFSLQPEAIFDSTLYTQLLPKKLLLSSHSQPVACF